jgi:SAM-dependent methyltransferase
MFKTEFEKEQFSSAYPIGVENNYWTVARNKILKQELSKIKTNNKKILEIGCGRGIVVEYLKKNGLDCYGVELAEIEVGRDLSAFIKTGIDFTELDQKFSETIEVVLVLDVIEHLPDDVDFLKKIKKTFKNIKYLIVTVPARQDIWSNYDKYYGHYRRYDLSMLFASISLAGFQKVSASYFFHTLYFLGKFLKISGLNRQVEINSPKGILIYFHKFIGFLFLWEYILGPNWLWGTSIISISKLNQ